MIFLTKRYPSKVRRFTKFFPKSVITYLYLHAFSLAGTVLSPLHIRVASLRLHVLTPMYMFQCCVRLHVTTFGEILLYFAVRFCKGNPLLQFYCTKMDTSCKSNSTLPTYSTVPTKMERALRTRSQAHR